MSTTSTSTGIAIRTGADGTRQVTTRTTTVERTGSPGEVRSFDHHFNRALAHNALPVPSAATPPHGAGESGKPKSLDDLLAQLNDLLQQLLDRMNDQHARARCTGPAPTTPTQPPCIGTMPPTGEQHQQSQPGCVAPMGMGGSHRVDAVECRPTRSFDVHAPDGSSTSGRIVVRGRLATEPVTEGAKLDEGIRRLADFLHQVGEHVQAGEQFSDDQLQSIADEALAIYHEAIRATHGDGDVGDYSPANRDGVLDIHGAVAAKPATNTGSLTTVPDLPHATAPTRPNSDALKPIAPIHQHAYTEARTVAA